MDKVTQLESRIRTLQEKKDLLEQKSAKTLYKKSTKVLGESFSPALVEIILKGIWENTDNAQKEVWLKKAETFRKTRSKKTLEN